MKLRSRLALAVFLAGSLAMPLAAFAQGWIGVPGTQGFSGYSGMSAAQFQSFNGFLNNHPQIASDLSTHPGLVRNSSWLDHNPAFRQYLANHPEINREFQRDPIGFMSAQGRYGWQRGNRTGWYQGWHRNWYQGQRSNFNTFLGQHPGMAQDLYQHPNYVHDKGWLQRNPEAQQYFNKHPGVSDEFRANPHDWISHESYRHGPKGTYRREQRQEYRHERQQQRREQRQQRHEGRQGNP